jgi:hypothetical protein
MKIGSTNVKISMAAIAVFVVFTLLLLITFYLTGDKTILVWGIPTVILLVVIPVSLSYMSQREYNELAPMYEAEAKTVRIRMINESMIGQVVRIQGVVEQVRFQFINRPQYVVADRSGEISVKMFTAPMEDVKKGDIVEVLGMVIMRYMVVGDPVVNGVVIRQAGATPAPSSGADGKKGKEKKD